MAERTANETEPVAFGEKLANSQLFTDLFRDGMALVEETATYLDGPGRLEFEKARTRRGACLCDREHAPDHAADAAGVLAAAASRRQGRRDVARPGQQGKIQGEARARGPRRPSERQAGAAASAGPDRALQGAAGRRCAGSTPPCMRAPTPPAPRWAIRSNARWACSRRRSSGSKWRPHRAVGLSTECCRHKRDTHHAFDFCLFSSPIFYSQLLIEWALDFRPAHRQNS